MTRRPEVIPNVRDHGVKPPAVNQRYDSDWVGLSRDLQRMYLSHYARFGAWSPWALTYPHLPQEEAEALRRQFLAHPRHLEWLGDFPGKGV